ncbi:MAG TPA: DUF2157 domain-containing protein [Flavisolibacter sp.]|nr:DUF2157 domain-containing protein [Flavisolibacter sp.]
MSIEKDIPELVEANIITEETATRIRNYYAGKGGLSQNKLLVVFGILGATLVGLGLILIIAHNWDELSRSLKTLFSFLPLITGQILCGFTLLKKHDSVAWRESTSAFLFCAVGASISLVSQVYNIPGNLSGFLFTWMLLCLPLVYVMRSSVASILYLTGITYYGCETGYWTYRGGNTYYYWLLLLLILPHYYLLYRNKPRSNFAVFHHWLLPLILIITLGTIAYRTEELMFVAYISLFGLFYLVGNTPSLKRQNSVSNSYLSLGSAGTVSILLALSFDWFWNDLQRKNFILREVATAPEFIASVLISLLAAVVLYFQKKGKGVAEIQPMETVFILFIPIFIVGLESSFAVILTNLLVFAIGVFTIGKGARLNHLGILNYGLIIITALVVCRFFDTDLSFIWRGLLCVAVGTGFFAANLKIIKKRKLNG